MKHRNRFPQYNQIVNRQLNIFLSGKCTFNVIRNFNELKNFCDTTVDELHRLGAPGKEVCEYIVHCLETWQDKDMKAGMIYDRADSDLQQLYLMEHIENKRKGKKQKWINRGNSQTS